MKPLSKINLSSQKKRKKKKSIDALALHGVIGTEPDIQILLDLGQAFEQRVYLSGVTSVGLSAGLLPLPSARRWDAHWAQS